MLMTVHTRHSFLAKVGLISLGWGSRIAADLHPPTLFYAVSQGALGIEIRSDDHDVKELCRAITHWETEWRCAAERACLRVLEGGCSVPVDIHTELSELVGNKNGFLKITGCVTSIDATKHVQHTLEGDVKSLSDAEDLGAKLAKVLLESGGKTILDEIDVDRKRRIGEVKTVDEKNGNTAPSKQRN